MSKVPISRNSVGIAGEFYIAYILAKHGFEVSMSLGRTKGFDLFVVNPNGTPMVISVKTTYFKVNKFILMNEKADELIGDHLYYAFVRLNAPDGIPEFWIAPSKIIAPVIKESHLIWMEGTSKSGKPHQENPMRNFYLTSRYTFPEDWEESLESYKSNIKLLEDLV